ncbi:MAG: hypothetical protein L0215_04125 [Gemmataceae bacterium]|nr:hypothetical protein [Gemmataceae bacterium]
MPFGMVSRFLETEARALLTRLGRVKPFVLQMPMLPAAGISPSALTAIERFLAQGRGELRGLVMQFLTWLTSRAGKDAAPAEAQRRFTFLRLRFNAILAQFDIFADVLNQRSEHESGVWLSGLDVAAADALALPGGYYEMPPVICYLDRGHGAAIRRARTRLPGGGDNPVAVVRVPRERMVGAGIASSLVHEVGHQGAALLDLINSLRPVLQGLQKKGGAEQLAWTLWERWISEILADFWALGRVGAAATTGLIGVVSLPRAFVFRISLDDPHPFAWIRVVLSCAMGNGLYPHAQWDRLARLWHAFYPTAELDPERSKILVLLQNTMPAFVALLVNHRPRLLRGKSLGEVLTQSQRSPERLTALYRQWKALPGQMFAAAPSMAFAVIGQARIDGHLGPEEESKLLAELLTHWAMLNSLNTTAQCALQQPAGTARPA